MADSTVAALELLLRAGRHAWRDWDVALEELLRADASVLKVDRVSFWRFRDEPPGIVCELGYVSARHFFERGAVVLDEGDARYLREARRLQIIRIEDARTDPRVGGLEPYLERTEVGALLDVPVIAHGRTVGILCHEHIGGPRRWTVWESFFALGIAQWLTVGFERRRRSNAEEAERRASFMAQTFEVLARTLDPAEAERHAVRLAIPILGEVVTLIGYDGVEAWRVCQLHQDREGQRVLDELAARYGGNLERPGIGMQALRDEQSLLLPEADAETLRAYGLEEDHIAYFARMGIRSMMAVPLRARTDITGVMTFASTGRSYDHDDLRFADEYARRVALLLSNIRLYARAQAAVRLREEFIELAAHELRTPLQSLTLSAALLENEIPGDGSSEARRAVEAVRRQTRRLSRLADLLVAASKHGRLASRVHRQAVDLGALARDVVDDFAESLEKGGCALDLGIEDGAWVLGDRGELGVVVANLLDNALKFGRGAPITVSVTRRGERVRVEVRDHGTGIPEAQRGQLFRRFGRGVSSRHFGGLGLGLSVAEEIVESHGGTIEAEAPAGGGTRIVVELPARPRRSAAPETTHEPRAAE